MLLQNLRDQVRVLPLIFYHLIFNYIAGDMMDRERAETLDDLVRLIKNEFNTELVLLFGSRARGDNLIESDYDIIIVSKDFEGINFIKRMGLVQDLWGGIYRLQAFCYTPEEFERKRNDIGTVQEACKEGIVL